MRPLTTSLSEIRSFRPCPEGWSDILAYRNSIAIAAGKEAADHEEQFPLVSCLESNSINDVLWLIGKRKAEIQIAVKFARMCADNVAHLNNRYAADAATYATYATYAAASATYATYAAASTASATYAADAATYATYASANYEEQKEKNKQFLIQCINEFTAQTMPAPEI